MRLVAHTSAHGGVRLVEAAVDALEAKLRDQLDAPEASGERPLLEARDVRLPEGLAFGAPDEARPGPSAPTPPAVGIDRRGDDRLLDGHAADRIQRTQWIGDVDQHASAEHEIEESDGVGREVVHVAVLLLHARPSCRDRKVEAPWRYSSFESVDVRAIELLFQDAAAVVRAPLRELCGHDALRTAALQLEREEAVRGPTSKAVLPVRSSGSP